MPLFYTYVSGVNNDKIVVNYNIHTESSIWDTLPTSKKVANTYNTSLDIDINNFETKFSYLKYFNNIQNLNLNYAEESFYSVFMILPKNLPKSFTLMSRTDEFILTFYYYYPITEQFINWINHITINSPRSNTYMSNISVKTIEPINKYLILPSGINVAITQDDKIRKDLLNVL